MPVDIDTGGYLDQWTGAPCFSCSRWSPHSDWHAPVTGRRNPLFNSVQAYQTSLGPHVQQIMEDIAKYTNSQPLIQIGEVKV